MKTIEQVMAAYRPQCLDGRDMARLMKYIPGGSTGGTDAAAKPLTRENVLAELERDVAFGFEKALNRRGISAGLMFDVVRMWNWILEEGLEGWDDDSYAMYGLPLFKATAEKYGFGNPIGTDSGTEDKYGREP